MSHLVSPFILEQYQAGAQRGDLIGATLFVDVVGFSTLTRTLMRQGQHGAEVLAGIMRAVFDPLVTAVYAHHGFVTLFAGDAFTAMMPAADEEDVVEAARHALAAAWEIREAVIAQSDYETVYGTFNISAKIGLAIGDCHWEIIRATEGEQATFYFRGSAIDQANAAEAQAGENTLLLTSAA